jgi:EAL domain-containing protein (putative c-di-GMP-specific phosphodiesterase class I)
MQKSLLIVDDEPQMLRALKRFFENEGYQTFTAENGNEALKILSQSAIQVIISDNQMPGMTGSELLRHIKKDYPKIIRIILSAQADFEAIKDAINEGSIYKFISKPWNDDFLRLSIQQAFLLYAQNNQADTVSINGILISAEDLQEALDKNQFEIYYQPILQADTEKIVAAEALLRWQHPTLGVLSPDTFISLCEVSQLIIPISIWILHQACHQLKRWQNQGYIDLSIAINISAQQFNNPGLVNIIEDVLTETSIPANSLELEITESIVMQNQEENIAQLKNLKTLNIKLCLDDFGTGYSSLRYIYEFPVNTLKIDKSFIQNLTSDAKKLELVIMIIDLTKKLNLTTIAEGVETRAQLKKLIELKCDMVQGYLFSKPITADDFTQLLQEN